MTVHVLALVSANGAFFLAGAGITRLIGLWRDVRELLSWFAVAYLAGTAAVGVGATLLLISGARLSLWQILALALVLAAPAASGLRPERSRPFPRRTSRRVGLFAGVAVALAALFAESIVQGLETWDSWAMWTMKAHALVLRDGLDPAVFAGTPYAGAHLDYPLFFPALQAIDFRFMGALDDQVIHLQSWFILAGSVLALERLLRGRASTLAVAPMLLLLTVSPATSTLVEMGYADVPAACFFALAALCAWFYLVDRRPAWIVLLALFAAASAGTKREVWTFVTGLFVVLLVSALRMRRPLLPVLASAVAVGATVVAWLAWLAAHGQRGHEDMPIGKGLNPAYLSGRIDRVGAAVRSLADYSFHADLWPVVTPLVLLTMLVALFRGRRALTCFVAAIVATTYLGLVWAFWISRAPVDWHLAHAGPRVIATPLFTLLAFWPLLAAPLEADEDIRLAEPAPA
jgi:hypothetical protein